MNGEEAVGNGGKEYKNMRVHFYCIPLFAIKVGFPKYVRLNLAKGKMSYAGLSEFLENFPK